MEWFDKIYQWIMENLAVITAWFGAGELGTIVTLGVLLVRNIKTSRHGSFLTDRLNDSLLENNKFAKGINSVINTVDEKMTIIDGQVHNIVEQFTLLNKEFHTTVDLLNSKIGAMMEVQTLVYSTIKDEDMRNNINKILTSAKYNDTGVQMEIAGEIAKMQEEFGKALADMQKTLEDTVQGINNANKIPGTVNGTNDIKRY